MDRIVWDDAAAELLLDRSDGHDAVAGAESHEAQDGSSSYFDAFKVAPPCLPYTSPTYPLDLP